MQWLLFKLFFIISKRRRQYLITFPQSPLGAKRTKNSEILFSLSIATISIWNKTHFIYYWLQHVFFVHIWFRNTTQNTIFALTFLRFLSTHRYIDAFRFQWNIYKSTIVRRDKMGVPVMYIYKLFKIGFSWFLL